MRAQWKGFHYVTPGVVPLGRGALWVDQVDRTLLVQTKKWGAQKSRPYYLTHPLGCFLRTTPAGRPAREKWFRRSRK